MEQFTDSDLSYITPENCTLTADLFKNQHNGEAMNHGRSLLNEVLIQIKVIFCKQFCKQTCSVTLFIDMLTQKSQWSNLRDK